MGGIVSVQLEPHRTSVLVSAISDTYPYTVSLIGSGGYGPIGVAYDSNTKEVFVTDEGSNAVSVFVFGPPQSPKNE